MVQVKVSIARSPVEWVTLRGLYIPQAVYSTGCIFNRLYIQQAWRVSYQQDKEQTPDSAVQCQPALYSAVQAVIMQCSASQYSTVRYKQVQCKPVQPGTVRCSASQYSAVQFKPVHCSAVKTDTVQGCASQYRAVQCKPVQCSVVQ